MASRYVTLSLQNQPILHFPPPVQPFCFFFSQPETPDSSDQIVLSVISSHEPVRTAAAEVEPVLLFPTNFMVQAEISQQILQEQGCSMLGGSISQEIQHLQIS